MRQETDRLQLIQKLGKHSKTMADTWLKLAVDLAIAALYSEHIGDENWIMNGCQMPEEQCRPHATT